MKEQEFIHGVMSRTFGVFKESQCAIRPHFVLTGPSGSGKSHLVQLVAKELDLALLTINAASLTKEGVSGNSLSKALAPLRNIGDAPAIVFCDEFDKLFVSGQAGSDNTHESLAGVQNEFLTVLENDQAAVFGDYGKYVNVPVSNCLFVFAGAFNGEKDMSIERLKELGIRNEFLGRVSLCFSTEKPSLDSLLEFLNQSDLLDKYLALFKSQRRASVIKKIAALVEVGYAKNTLGVRGVNSLIHQHFLQA
ncbi:gp041 [Erwinia phage vB_EamP-S6]|uniref:Gp041 n=1 Tax=Erwinia phage vB_EamP-S6 TaxID=1051675 RepID=G0YQD3_9CAUD|nr:gp041 [Erwinia phage vB_EamP-S6]AEJ81560.1 gp041 [Erwinia phage vB_EamP-S6]